MQQNVATYVSRGSVASLSCQGHAFSGKHTAQYQQR